jgi:hypothetical protein
MGAPTAALGAVSRAARLSPYAATSVRVRMVVVLSVGGSLCARRNRNTRRDKPCVLSLASPLSVSLRNRDPTQTLNDLVLLAP